MGNRLQGAYLKRLAASGYAERIFLTRPGPS